MDMPDTADKKWQIPGIRYVFVAVGFLGMVELYAVRVNLNVAIVAMVKGAADISVTNSSATNECGAPKSEFNNGSFIEDIPNVTKYDWSPKLQGIVLGAFYYGNFITPIPGGRLAEIYSAKWVFGIGNFITAMLNMMIPMMADFSVYAVIAVRALAGFVQGVTLPAMYYMQARWLPDNEKNFLSSIIYTGLNVGTVTGMGVTGLLCESQMFGGWPSSFYAIGIFGCIWFVIWCVLITNSPEEHPCITNSESKYIISSISRDENGEKLPVPWKKILTCLPVIAFVVMQSGIDWCFYTFLTNLPTFFHNILNFSIAKNGFLSSLPHLLKSVLSPLVGFVCDLMIRKGIATTNFVRKFCTGASGILPALGLLAVCFSGCNVTLCVIFFVLSVACIGFCTCGDMMSPFDLSPEYAGTLMGISSTVVNFLGSFTPVVVGVLTDENQTLYRWHIVFGICITVLVASTIFFQFFGSTEKQNWTSTNSEKTNQNMNMGSSYNITNCVK